VGPDTLIDYTNKSIGVSDQSVGAGRKNTALILAQDPDAPAAKACKNYSGGGKSDWFLPSVGELEELFENFFSQTLSLAGGYTYWSSSECDANMAYFYSPYGTPPSVDRGAANKDAQNYACAVRAF